LCRRDVKDPVVEEMKKQPLNAEAQLKGCRFIVLKGWQNEMYQRHFVEVGAAELVANALKNHAENRELVAACCAAIFVLAFASKETQNRLVGMGVCEMIVKVGACVKRIWKGKGRGEKKVCAYDTYINIHVYLCQTFTYIYT
jgi:hypothetical protein